MLLFAVVIVVNGDDDVVDGVGIRSDDSAVVHNSLYVYIVIENCNYLIFLLGILVLNDDKYITVYVLLSLIYIFVT